MRYATFILLVTLASASLAADRTAADAYLAGVPPLVAANEYKTIEDLCKRSLQSDENCPLAHYYIGLCLEKSGKAHDAFKSYQTAAALATKEKDTGLATKATAAAKRLGAGIMEIDALDQKLADKLIKIGTDALDTGRADTAKSAFTSLLAIQPENAKAKDGLEKAVKALKDRSNPIKTKIAAAMLTETWYKIGIGKKDDAVTLAKSLSQKYGDTEWGKEAAGLIERDFAAPKKEEVAELAQKLKDPSAKPPETPKTPGSPSVAAVIPTTAPNAKPKAGLDVEALSKAADADTLKMPKDGLVTAFVDAHKAGKALYAKATPGVEGNQENLTKALEHFVKAESIFTRIESEKLLDDSVAESAKEVGMLRYACMKMTILAR